MCEPAKAESRKSKSFWSLELRKAPRNGIPQSELLVLLMLAPTNESVELRGTRRRRAERVALAKLKITTLGGVFQLFFLYSNSLLLSCTQRRRVFPSLRREPSFSQALTVTCERAHLESSHESVRLLKLFPSSSRRLSSADYVAVLTAAQFRHARLNKHLPV